MVWCFVLSRLTIVLADCCPIDDTSLYYANVISELAVVSHGVLAFADSHFSLADACSFIGVSVYCLIVMMLFLCTSNTI